MAGAKEWPWRCEEIRSAFQCNHLALIENLKPKPIIGELYELHLITLRQKEELDRKDYLKGNIAQAEQLLDIILKKDDKTLKVFVNMITKKQSELFQELQKTIDKLRKKEIVPKNDKCVDHKEECGEFCEECKVPICDQCILKTKHRDHRTYKISDLETRFKNTMSSSINENWELVDHNKDSSLKKIQDNYDRCTKQVKTEAEKLVVEVKRREERLLYKLAEKKKEHMENVTTAVSSYKSKNVELQKRKTIIRRDHEGPNKHTTFREKLQFQQEKCEEIDRDRQDLDMTATVDMPIPNIKPCILPSELLDSIHWESGEAINVVTKKRSQRSGSNPQSVSAIPKDKCEPVSPSSYKAESNQDFGETTPKVPTSVTSLGEISFDYDQTPNDMSGRSEELLYVSEDETEVKVPGGCSVEVDMVTSALKGKVTRKQDERFSPMSSSNTVKTKRHEEVYPITKESPKNHTEDSPDPKTKARESLQELDAAKHDITHAPVRHFDGNYESISENIDFGKCIAKINGECRRMACIQDHVWLPLVDKDKIHIYTMDGTLADAIPVQNPIAVCLFEKWAFVACKSGIHQLLCNRGVGDVSSLKPVATGSYSDVYIYNGKLYAWEYKSKNVVCFGITPDMTGESPVKIEKEVDVAVSVKKKESSVSDKILVYQEKEDGPLNFLLSEWAGHTVLKVNEDGKVLDKFGDRDNLKNPFLCGRDVNGNLFLADQKNNSFKVVHMSSKKWKNGKSPFIKFVYDIICLSNGVVLSLGYDSSSVLFKGHIPPNLPIA